MYKITRTWSETDGVIYRVSHFANGDPNPTPTERVYYGGKRPEAWRDALGSAAKQSIILDRPQIVESEDGRRYEVTVKELTS